MLHRRRATWTKDRANFSTIWYLVSGSYSVLLTKYTGCCVPSKSWILAGVGECVKGPGCRVVDADGVVGSGDVY